MILLNLIFIEVSKRRNAIIGWGLGLAAFAIMIMSIAPTLAEQFAQLDLSAIPVYQAFGITEAIDSAIALLGVYLPFFGLMLAVYGAITGSNALAGEEDNGSLEMQLSLPIRRSQLVVAKGVGILIALFAISMITFAAFALMHLSLGDTLDSSLTMGDFFNVSWEMVPISLFFAMLAMFLGSILPTRGVTLGTTIAVLIAGYLINNLGGTVDALENLRPLTSFYYYNGADALQGDLNMGHVAVLMVESLLLLIGAVYFFGRRDVTVGLWPWQAASKPAAPPS